ncbi:MAG: hypothetical protein A2514_11475 [Gammaproteobacteria bacterium RIFOXYD12_FULL_61_37]|nr:MAG: hypothetical protein A2514_11475 [Gammaproteobacteria bacterium RIFOXYD12_FULL_61_37]
MSKQSLTLVVDLDERGIFKAHVDDAGGKEVFAFSSEDEETGRPSDDGLWLVEDGWMRHGKDVCGLLEYMQSMGVVGKNAALRLEG